MELSNFLQGKMEEKVNVNLDSSILDKAQPYSFSFKKNACYALQGTTISFSQQDIYEKTQ